MPLQLIASNVVNPGFWFDGINVPLYAGKVYRNSAGHCVIELLQGDVHLLPSNWREQAEHQGQQIQTHEPD